MFKEKIKKWLDLNTETTQFVFPYEEKLINQINRNIEILTEEKQRLFKNEAKNIIESEFYRFFIENTLNNSAKEIMSPDINEERLKDIKRSLDVLKKIDDYFKVFAYME